MRVPEGGESPPLKVVAALMTRSMIPRVVVAVGLLIVAGFAGLVVSSQPLDLGWLAIGLVAYLVGAITMIRVPENRVSWVLLVSSAGFALTSFHWLPGGIGRALNFIGIFGVIMPGLGVLLPLWFPTGNPPSRNWRWVEIAVWAAVAGLVASQVIGIALGQINDDVEGCVSVHTCIELTSVVLTLLSIAGAVMSLVVRWVRSHGIERQQMKAVVLAFSLFAIGMAIEFGVQQDHPVGSVLLIAGGLLIPVSIGVAIVRYRLYDIDRLVSRTVTYALVAGLLAVIFAAGVVWIPSALRLGDSQLLVAGSTLAVAALFNPLRKRIRSLVDRRFNRSRYDAERVMDEFADSLRDRVDPDGVVEGWVGVVNGTMQPSTVGVWVRD